MVGESDRTASEGNKRNRRSLDLEERRAKRSRHHRINSVKREDLGQYIQEGGGEGSLRPGRITQAYIFFS